MCVDPLPLFAKSKTQDNLWNIQYFHEMNNNEARVLPFFLILLANL